MGGSSKEQTVGFRYYFGIHMGVGRGPVDAMHEIRVANKRAWRGEVTSNSTINIDAPDIFGGEEKEGGIQGPLELMFGEPTQEASSGLKAMLGSVIPGFRGMFTAFFNGLVCMNNPYPKSWKFRFNRTLKGWDGAVWNPSKVRIPLIEGEVSEEVLIADYTEFETDWTTAHPECFSTIGGGIMNTLVNSINYRYETPPPFPYLRKLSGEFTQELVDKGDTLLLRVEFTDGNAVHFIPQNEVSLLDPDSWAGFNVNGTIYEIEGLALTEGNAYRVEMTFNRSTAKMLYNIKSNEGTILATGDFPFPLSQSATTTFFGFVRSSNANPAQTGYTRYTRVTYEGSQLLSAYSMNPAHIIYECLTNRVWGRGLASSKLDLDAFTVAAQTLYDEGFGLCLKWTRKDSIESFVQGVLDHIGGVLYVSRTTKLLTLKLIRADYTLASLPTFDTESGVLEISEAAVSSVGTSVNAVFVNYHDWRNDEDLMVGEKNVAAIAAAGGVVNSTTKSYPGIPTANLALRVAMRDLRSASTNLRRFTVVMDRRGEDIEPGSVFALEDPKRGIPRMAVRVGRIEDGTLTDGRITFSVIQDVFSLPENSMTAEVPGTWVPPNTRPCIDQQLVMEAPYFVLAGRMSKADLDFVTPDSGYIAALNSRGQPLNQGFRIAVRNAAPTVDDNPSDDSYVCET